MRTKGFNEKETTQVNGLTTSVAVILSKVEYIESEVKDIRQKMEKDYVTQQEFEPVKRIVYGLASVILLAVAGAIVALVLKK